MNERPFAIWEWLIVGVLAVLLLAAGAGLEHWRHGRKCEAAKEQHGIRVSGQAFDVGVAMGYQLRDQGWPASEAQAQANRRRDQGWSNSAVFHEKPNNRPYMVIQ